MEAEKNRHLVDAEVVLPAVSRYHVDRHRLRQRAGNFRAVDIPAAK
jgi:hypothetical protein